MRNPTEPSATLSESDANDLLIALHVEKKQAVTACKPVIAACVTSGVIGLAYDLMLIKARFFADMSSDFQANVTTLCDAVSPDHLIPWGFTLFLSTALAAKFTDVALFENQLKDNVRDIEAKRRELISTNRKWFGDALHEGPSF